MATEYKLSYTANEIDENLKKIDELPISKGEGNDSLISNSNRALATNGTSFGYTNQSGAKGYYIKSIDTVNKKIYLSTEQVLFPEISEVDNTDNSMNVEDYINSESKLFTIVNRIPYTNYIVEAVNNVITYQDDFEFTEIDTDSSNTNDFSFIVNDMTDVGAVTFGMNNHAIGYGNKAYGENSNAEGKETVASGNGSHSEGRSTVASGNYSHTEGYQTKAIGLHSHAEGLKTITKGNNSHAEGHNTQTIGDVSHSEGYKTTASGDASHAEGNNNETLGLAAHAEGYGTKAVGDASHTEGQFTLTSGMYSHAEGRSKGQATDEFIESLKEYISGEISNEELLPIWKENKFTAAVGSGAHAEGFNTLALGNSSHAEGIQTASIGNYSHSEGKDTSAIGLYSHAEGTLTEAVGEKSHAEGNTTKAYANNSHAEGYKSTTNSEANYSHAEGRETITNGEGSHAEGFKSEASGNYSHAEGGYNKAVGPYSYARGLRTIAKGENSYSSGQCNKDKIRGTDILEVLNSSRGDEIIEDWDTYGFNAAIGSYSYSLGYNTLAFGSFSHAEGYETKAVGNYSHAMGSNSNASGNSSHAEGDMTIAEGGASHAEGGRAHAIGGYSHAEGWYGTSEGSHSHAEGWWTHAKGIGSHAEGNNTIAGSSYQHVQGSYNIEDSNNEYVQIIGGGYLDTSGRAVRNNLYTLKSSTGDAWHQGSVQSTGSDYAEYFEWLDGNPNNEDRVGTLVALDGEKIRLATEGDEVLGVVSGTVAILGDNYECEWNGKYLTDDFGRVIYDMVEEFIDVEKFVTKEVEVPVETIVEGEEGADEAKQPTEIKTITEKVIEKKSLGFFKRPRLNPEYDPEKAYVNRANRPEWDAVGMLGKLFVRDDGTCQVNGYATVGENGVATASEEKTNMRVLSRINDNVIRVLLK